MRWASAPVLALALLALTHPVWSDPAKRDRAIYVTDRGNSRVVRVDADAGLQVVGLAEVGLDSHRERTPVTRPGWSGSYPACQGRKNHQQPQRDPPSLLSDHSTDHPAYCVTSASLTCLHPHWSRRLRRFLGEIVRNILQQAGAGFAQRAHEANPRAQDVPAHDALGLVRVASPESADDRGVLLCRRLGVPGDGQAEAPVPVDVVPQETEQIGALLVPTGSEDDLVELPAGLGDALQVSRPAVRAGHLVHEEVEAGQIVLAQPCGSLPRRQALEHAAHDIQLTDLPKGKHGDDNSAVRPASEESLGFQTQDRLTERRPADIEHFGQLGLDQALSLTDLTADNGLFQGIIGLIPDRNGLKIGIFERIVGHVPSSLFLGMLVCNNTCHPVKGVVPSALERFSAVSEQHVRRPVGDLFH